MSKTCKIYPFNENNEKYLKCFLIRWSKAGEKEEEKRWKGKEEEKEKEEEEEEERWEERQRYNIKNKSQSLIIMPHWIIAKKQSNK